MLNLSIGMLFVFVALGVASSRLGRYAYILMGLVIISFVIYAFRSG